MIGGRQEAASRRQRHTIQACYSLAEWYACLRWPPERLHNGRALEPHKLSDGCMLAVDRVIEARLACDAARRAFEQHLAVTAGEQLPRATTRLIAHGGGCGWLRGRERRF